MSSKKYRYDIEPIEKPERPSLAPVVIGGVAVVVVGLILISLVRRALSFLIGLGITAAVFIGLAYLVAGWAKRRGSQRGS